MGKYSFSCSANTLIFLLFFPQILKTKPNLTINMKRMAKLNNSRVLFGTWHSVSSFFRQRDICDFQRSRRGMTRDMGVVLWNEADCQWELSEHLHRNYAHRADAATGQRWAGSLTFAVGVCSQGMSRTHVSSVPASPLQIEIFPTPANCWFRHTDVTSYSGRWQ